MNTKKRIISKEEVFLIAIKTAEETNKEKFSWEILKTKFPYAKDQEFEIDSSEEMTADQKARRKASLMAGYAYSYYVKNPTIKTLDDFVLKLRLIEQVKERLAQDDFSDQEKQIIIFRFGLEDGQTKTLDEVAKRFDVTRERIRHIEGKALRKRHSKERDAKLRKLTKDFLEE